MEFHGTSAKIIVFSVAFTTAFILGLAVAGFGRVTGLF